MEASLPMYTPYEIRLRELNLRLIRENAVLKEDIENLRAANDDLESANEAANIRAALFTRKAEECILDSAKNLDLAREAAERAVEDQRKLQLVLHVNSLLAQQLAQFTNQEREQVAIPNPSEQDPQMMREEIAALRAEVAQLRLEADAARVQAEAARVETDIHIDEMRREMHANLAPLQRSVDNLMRDRAFLFLGQIVLTVGARLAYAKQTLTGDTGAKIESLWKYFHDKQFKPLFRRLAVEKEVVEFASSLKTQRNVRAHPQCVHRGECNDVVMCVPSAEELNDHYARLQFSDDDKKHMEKIIELLTTLNEDVGRLPFDLATESM